MTRRACWPLLLCLLVLAPACTIEHRVADDYAQYLANNTGTSELPRTDLSVEYAYSEATRAHSHGFRAVTVGYAHLWIVEFGRILDATLHSSDVQAAFAGLQPAAAGAMPENGLLFELQDYRFEDYGAHVSLRITWTADGRERISKTYASGGLSQGAKMFWGGPFAMKNAIHQSTKNALDSILAAFLADAGRPQEWATAP